MYSKHFKTKKVSDVVRLIFRLKYAHFKHFTLIWDYYEIGVHFFEKNKDIVKKENCANNFQYRLNFSKKTLKVSYCQENNFFQPKLARKDEKR